MRTTLIRIDAREHRLLATLHHIVSDGWSMELLEREVGALYGALATGLPPSLPELPVQYGDYAVWQRSWLAGHELERQLAFWRSRLAEPPALELPTDRPRPAIWSQRGGVETASLPGELTERLEQVGRSHGATTFLTFFAVFLALLQRYTSQEDLVVGTPLAGRGRPEVQDLIGFFVNTLALRVSLDGDPSFETLLGRVRETVLEAYDHQDVPFEKLVAELAPTPDLSRNPLFQVVFGIQERLEQLRIGDDLVLSAGEWVHHKTAKFDLTLHAYRTDRELQLWAEYGADLFDAATIQRLLGHFRRLMEGIAAEGGDRVRLSELALLEDAEREQVLVEWNRTRQEIPEEPVHRLFFRWAEATPDALAVSWEGGSLTYAALARRAAELAGRLRSQGVGPETVVALRLERSAELVIAALAVLEAGGAYLPIDPAHPLERAEWILRDSGAALLLTKEDLQDPSLTLPRFAGEGGAPLLPHALAYVIYTSGSTGTPKGTELRHHGLSSIIAWHRRAYGIGPADRCPLLAGPGFDASIWDTWAALTAGASLHVPAREVVLSPPALFAWFEEKGITVSFLATPLAEAFLAEEEARSSRLALRYLLTGGDRLRRRPRPGLPFELINHYGPTESTIVATAGRVALAGERSPDIGVPLDNTRVYILDRWLQPVPVGVPGELCLAGDGLARCYRNRPELTASAFVPDPFGDSFGGGQRLYRTGDLARWLPSGVIEFLGRADHQVKIRGQRIELGEIEATLGRHPAVRDSVVMVRDERLVAWVVTRETREAVTVESLRAWLAKTLTEAMIPVAWAFLDALPLTPNGKVDRRALPAPEAAQDEEAFVPPATATQRALARIWGGLLGLERVGARDNFFQLGGHSLSATQLAARVHERFGIDLELRAVFENPVLEAMAAHVDSVRGSSQADAGREGMYPLSFAQQRLWFLDRL
ncbi:MAG TPA: amino acid adenylation domain-containing protein, partial [Thermoanaerobaculia bacterium]